MKVAIMTDTNSGILPNEGAEKGIYVLPMPFIVDGENYLEGVSITHKQLYEYMRQDLDVSTSMPSPGSIMDMWKQIFADGYDEIVYIPMSSGLSSSCASARSFAAEYDGKVQVVDNHRISVTLLESVYDAKYMADNGKSAKEIKERLEETAYDASIYITVDTLKYLKKSGRVTPAAAAIATMINLKPILTIQGEKLDSYAKVRGLKQSEHRMIEALKHDLETRFADVPKERIRVATAGTIEDPADAETWRLAVQEAFPEYEVYYMPLSCSIACHTGIGAVGIGMIVVEENR